MALINTFSRHFNPRSLAGATFDYGQTCFIADFNPRSLAGATVYGLAKAVYCLISIHAPSRERLHV